jgi:arylsulfatase
MDSRKRFALTSYRRLSCKLLTIASAAAIALLGAAPWAQAQDKPNILVIFGDDIGQTNVSAYSFGVMGYKTPNIDRIA